MDDRENLHPGRGFLVENDVGAMFVPANARRDRLRHAPHSGMAGQEFEDAFKFGEISLCLVLAEPLIPKKRDVVEVGLGALRQAES